MGLVIPLFIPHRGCPHQCLFCNQESITGCAEPKADYGEEAIATIEEWLARESLHGELREREVAFYGGSFTCLPEEEQARLLALVQPYIDRGLVDGIRLSTRPDCISKDIAEFLVAHRVKKVELGVQSMDDGVLRAAKRGHSALDCRRAIAILQAAGLQVGVQLMAGLPRETTAIFLRGLDEIIGLRPDFVRLYPVVVVRHSELEDLYLKGRYQPISLAKAVAFGHLFRVRMDRADIPIIRMGLQPSKDLEQMLVAGPYHPAFGELVGSRLWLKEIRHRLRDLQEGENLLMTISHRDLSVAQGMKKYNIRRIQALGYGDRFSIQLDVQMTRGTRKFSVEKG
ncbi:elongator complex protein 3 [Desulfotalea psychrophila]|uniref:Radical SAM core domain-containing protein n=1 Tax=Desulfotalea psychrophila (strain LSv54 / DSM 12343) TaxID=177439 RepID=Q6ANU9_DESPS|nr:radical SAM protein [Desulfotalea psychrophila]CAG35975.1 conserved hypothetical protein [Desulfotalea psychrophila LSv54]